MKLQKLVLLAAVAMFAALSAMASDGPEGGQMKVTAVKSMLMGSAVKNAPYSGEEVTTSDQTLGDGTKIHTESRTKVHRDSEGRVRRDTPDHIQILDPVAGVSYMLDPKTMTATKVSFLTSNTTFNSIGDGNTLFKTQARSGASGAGELLEMPLAISISGSTSGADVAFLPRQTGEAGAVLAGGSNPEATKAEMDAMKKMQMAKIAEGQFGTAMSYSVGLAAGSHSVGFAAGKAAAGKREQLATQVIEGILSEGMRTTRTLPAGSIGNDREIDIVAERWYSPDLKTVMVTEHSDPRSGKDSFRLTGVSRNEPDPALFTLPVGYKLSGPRAPAQ